MKTSIPKGLLNIKRQDELRPYQRDALRQLAKNCSFPIGTMAGPMDMLLVGFKGGPCPTVRSIEDANTWPMPHSGSPVAVYVGGLDDSIFWPTEELHAVQLKRRNDIAQQMLKRPPPQGY